MKKAYHLFLVLFPILSGYGYSPSVDFGNITILLLGLICSFYYNICEKQDIKIALPDGYSLFFAISIILCVFYAKTIPLRLLLYSINLCLAMNFLDYKLLKQYYYHIVTICCVFFFIQEFSYKIIGFRISGLTTAIPLIYNDSPDYISTLLETDRSTTFFLEASYFAQYMFPCLVLELFSKRKISILAITVTVVIFFSGSGNGLLIISFVWLYWFLASKISIAKKITFLSLFALTAIFFIISNPEILTRYLNRSAELASFNGEEQYFSSGFIRFFRGYYLYSDLPLINKLLGTNPNIVDVYLNNNPFFQITDHFINGVQTLLIYNGLFVCILYLRHIGLFFKSCFNQKAIFVLSFCFIYLLFSESYYLCSRSFLLTLIIIGLKRNQQTASNELIVQS